MTMETGGSVPEDGAFAAYAFQEGQDVGEPEDVPVLREEELVTSSGEQAETVEEVITSRANMVTATALDEVYYAGTERDSMQHRRDVIVERIAALAEERDTLEDNVAATERQMRQMLVKGRTDLWNTSSEQGPYLSGKDMIANAVRLSPTDDEAESADFREARVRVISDLSSTIKEGIPTLIVDRSGEPAYRNAYSAAIPEHGGFSAVLVSDEGELQFKLGINGEPVAAIIDATIVATDPATPEDRRPEHTTALIEVYTGQGMAEYVNDLVTTKTSAITLSTRRLEELDEINERRGQYHEMVVGEKVRRDGERQELVGAVTAARQVEMPVVLEDDVRAQTVEAIVEYLLDIGDELRGRHGLLVDAGLALQYVYPANAETALADLLIEKSNERTRELYSEHYVSPVVTVLQRVCGMRGSLPENLLLR